MKKIIIVDYGMGNIGSVLNMFKHIGVEAEITADLQQIADAEKLLLPGVGAFDHAMRRIIDTGFKEVLDKKALVDKVPILGICLGMQLLTRGSEEGNLPGLGWISADTIKFPPIPGLKVPHMGWNLVKPITPCVLTDGLREESRYYFVHSYHVKVDSEENSVLRTTHGVEFDSAIHADNIYGTQFHPEKSHKFGMELLKNFSQI
jgi:glutamine amidotransferase